MKNIGRVFASICSRMPETYNNNFLQINSKQPGSELPRAGQGQWLVSAGQFVYKCAIIHHLVFNYRKIIVSVVSAPGDGVENVRPSCCISLIRG